MEFQALPADSPDLVGYDRPELMAIGDSIFNGTRSLTTSPGLARMAAPVMVARGLGIQTFRAPDYPRPVLVDFEQFIRDGIDFGRLRAEILENAQKWFDAGGVWSSRRFFDNISIAGATYADLHENTSGDLKTQAQQRFLALKNADSPDYSAVAALYYAINGAFLLNPSGDPDLDDLTPLEQVASRRPKRLLINIGNNDGLFRGGITATWTRAYRDQLAEIPDHAAELGDVLKAECGDVERIYFNTLIRPRALANPAPRTDEELYNTPADGGYFDLYVGRLGSLNGLSAKMMRQFDDDVAAANEGSRKALTDRLGDRVRFVDLYEWASGHDRKHGTETAPLWVGEGFGRKRMSNYPLSGLGGFRQGGIFSLDNMHPTLVGYALLANTIGETVKATEGVAYVPMATDDAYEADTLLQDLPGNLDFLHLLASLFGAFVDV